MAGIETGVTARLHTALAEALAARDMTAASALRSALAAIGNAEAVGIAGDQAASRTTGAHFAGTTAGLGSAEAPRRVLSEAEIGQIVRAEISDRQAAARQYDALGRADRARRLRSEIAVLMAALRRPQLAAAGPPVAVRTAAEHAVDSGADAAILGHELADYEDHRRDGPEVAADPQDSRADLLVGEGRQGHAWHVVVDRIPGRAGEEAHGHSQDPHE
jgi:uncharacterized protein